jgi:drug/metabolite transporter (DMT)-like permease
MGTNSFIFFGLLLIPLLAFLIWMIKQDKKKNYLGLVLLVVGIVIATYTIITLDKKFMQKATSGGQVAPKSSSFK